MTKGFNVGHWGALFTITIITLGGHFPNLSHKARDLMNVVQQTWMKSASKTNRK